MDKSSSLGCPCTPRNIQEVQTSKLGDAQGIPSSSTKQQVIFLCAIFYCFIRYVLFLERLYFCLQFSFVLFSVAYGWIPAYLFWRETHSVLIAQNTLVFTFIVLRVFQFASTAFSSCSFTRIMFRARQYSLFMYDQISGPYCISSLRVISNKLIGVGYE